MVSWGPRRLPRRQRHGGHSDVPGGSLQGRGQDRGELDESGSQETLGSLQPLSPCVRTGLPSDGGGDGDHGGRADLPFGDKGVRASFPQATSPCSCQLTCIKYVIAATESSLQRQGLVRLIYGPVMYELLGE